MSTLGELIEQDPEMAEWCRQKQEVIGQILRELPVGALVFYQWDLELSDHRTNQSIPGPTNYALIVEKHDGWLLMQCRRSEKWENGEEDNFGYVPYDNHWQQPDYIKRIA
jgi:hypothetical protein